MSIKPVHGSRRENVGLRTLTSMKFMKTEHLGGAAPITKITEHRTTARLCPRASPGEDSEPGGEPPSGLLQPEVRRGREEERILKN